MKKFGPPVVLALASVALFVRGYLAAQRHEIIHDKMGRSSTGNQQMVLWAAWFVVGIVWIVWLRARDRQRS